MTKECVDPGSTSIQLKRPHGPEKTAVKKKVKVTKTSVDPITLTEGDLFNIGETIHEVTKDAL